MNDVKVMNKAADNIRILAASMVEKAKSGHPGGAMGGADFVNVLFSEFLVYDPKNPTWEGRDRFFLDPGHMSPMLYSVLALAGKFSMEELANFRQWGSVTPGHPEVDVLRGIENTSGPLGQGHTYAVGAAIAAKFLKARLGNVMGQTIYAYISDGGIEEEISQRLLGIKQILGAPAVNPKTDRIFIRSYVLESWFKNIPWIDQKHPTEIIRNMAKTKMLPQIDPKIQRWPHHDGKKLKRRSGILWNWKENGAVRVISLEKDKTAIEIEED